MVLTSRLVHALVPVLIFGNPYPVEYGLFLTGSGKLTGSGLFPELGFGSDQYRPDLGKPYLQVPVQI
jgi:hypothetical protein